MDITKVKLKKCRIEKVKLKKCKIDYSKTIFIHCPTKQDWIDVCKKIEAESDLRWTNLKPTKFENWNEYIELSCIIIKNNQLDYTAKKYFDENAPITSAKDFLCNTLSQSQMQPQPQPKEIEIIEINNYSQIMVIQDIDTGLYSVLGRENQIIFPWQEKIFTLAWNGYGIKNHALPEKKMEMVPYDITARSELSENFFHGKIYLSLKCYMENINEYNEQFHRNMKRRFRTMFHPIIKDNGNLLYIDPKINPESIEIIEITDTRYNIVIRDMDTKRYNILTPDNKLLFLWQSNLIKLSEIDMNTSHPLNQSFHGQIYLSQEFINSCQESGIIKNDIIFSLSDRFENRYHNYWRSEAGQFNLADLREVGNRYYDHLNYDDLLHHFSDL